MRTLVWITAVLLATSPSVRSQQDFLRGDADRDGRVAAVRDALFIVSAIFSAGPLVPCPDAQDVNDDGSIDLTDVVELLQFGYVTGASPIPAPGALVCGPDPTPDGLDCEEYPNCAAPAPLPVDPEIVYRLPSIQGEAETTVEVTVELDNTSEWGLYGWSIGVCHDASVIECVDAENALAIESDFFESSVVPGGFVIGVIPSFVLLEALAPGVEQPLVALTFELLAPGISPLEFCDVIGTHTLANHVTTTGWAIASPTRVDGEVVVVPATLFRRGDTNGDGQFDVADPIFGIMYLFAGGAPPLCEDAGDANDDGALNIADAIHLLNALFEAGPPPAAPGPLDCGIDSTADGLDCASAPAC